MVDEGPFGLQLSNHKLSLFLSISTSRPAPRKPPILPLTARWIVMLQATLKAMLLKKLSAWISEGLCGAQPSCTLNKKYIPIVLNH